ncbi:MAG: maleylpyruvate isomerase N-terminal domain-containing protein, partial [Tepidiformaceae bacterium]
VEGRLRWGETLEGVPGERMLEPVFEGGWSLKDVIAHVSEWEGVAATRLEFSLDRCATAPDFEGMDIDERNQRYFDRNRERTPAAVVEQEATNWTRLLAVTELMTEEQLNDPALPKTGPAHAPWQMIAGNAHEHFDEHIEQIHDWLGGD